MEANNELRLNVDEQQDDKTFKVKTDIDDSDEVQEITAARIPITCNQTVAWQTGCKQTYIERAHWALVKLLWQNVQQEVDNYIYEACEPCSSKCSLKKIRLNKHWINCCWEGRINNKQVSGNYEEKKNNEKRQSKI